MTQQNKAVLTDVGPGMPMNQAMKRYWLPACLSADLPECDSDPIRLELLEETYVGFRDSNGRVGVLDEHCCHRGASLCLGRVEKGGIQCIYHGWRYDADGVLLETPNVADDRVRSRIRQRAYPVREEAGIVFVYLGPRELEPPFPEFPFAGMPETNRYVTISVASTSYTQVLEGLLDSSHVGVLHTDVLKRLAAGIGPAPVLGGHSRTEFGGQASDLAPKLEVQDAEFGFRYAAIRQLKQDDGEVRSLARVTSFALPTSIYIPPGNIIMIALPVRSDRTHLFHIYWDETEPFTADRLAGMRHYYGIDEAGMGPYGLSRETHDDPSSPNRSNMWKQDRGAMRRGESFNGLYQFMQEDYAVASSMGSIQDVRKQNLVPADIAIAHFRKLMVSNAEAVARGEDPIGLDPAVKPAGVANWTTKEHPWKQWFAVAAPAEDGADIV